MEYIIGLIILAIVIFLIVNYFQGKKTENDYRNSREFTNRRNDFKKQIDKVKKDKK